MNLPQNKYCEGNSSRPRKTYGPYEGPTWADEQLSSFKNMGPKWNQKTTVRKVGAFNSTWRSQKNSETQLFLGVIQRKRVVTLASNPLSFALCTPFGVSFGNVCTAATFAFYYCVKIKYHLISADEKHTTYRHSHKICFVGTYAWCMCIT